MRTKCLNDYCFDSLVGALVFIGGLILHFRFERATCFETKTENKTLCNRYDNVDAGVSRQSLKNWCCMNYAWNMSHDIIGFMLLRSRIAHINVAALMIYPMAEVKLV